LKSVDRRSFHRESKQRTINNEQQTTNIGLTKNKTMAITDRIIIAGAGGIGQAVALILTEFSESPLNLFIGNRTLEKAEEVTRWINLGTTKIVHAEPFHLPEDGTSDSMKAVLEEADVLLDCLPGSEAPRMAQLARTYGLHYANLTEYISETEQIETIAEGAETGFVLQTGLAPGFVDVLANGIFQRFCQKHQVDKVGYVAMKVGALTRHATAPHFYGFTWSPVGVATEYIKDTSCIRNYEKTKMPALSDREKIIINGMSYEADLTSGGAADLPDALAGKVERLDYKTLRYPGHYAWVDEQLSNGSSVSDPVHRLRSRMEACIPHVKDDLVLIYASVEGKDYKGVWQKEEQTYNLHPQQIGRHILRAIQATTAAPLAEAAELLLQNKQKGIIRQSHIDPDSFLNGRFITAIYGKWDGVDKVPGGVKYNLK
jgi:saccharopine dehydrogenase-like NADP-dependent oxidoreductase